MIPVFLTDICFVVIWASPSPTENKLDLSHNLAHDLATHPDSAWSSVSSVGLVYAQKRLISELYCP